MTHEQLGKLHKNVCDQARILLKIKDNDYSGEGIALKNIIDAAEACGIPPEVGAWNRAFDKVSRISNFIKKGEFKVKSEKLEDTIYDLINYVIFVLALYIDKTKPNKLPENLSKLVYNNLSTTPYFDYTDEG